MYNTQEMVRFCLLYPGLFRAKIDFKQEGCEPLHAPLCHLYLDPCVTQAITVYGSAPSAAALATLFLIVVIIQSPVTAQHSVLICIIIINQSVYL